MIHPTGAIGRFKILRLLGKGNQSEVYLAHDPHLDREVAIKTLSFAFSAEHEGQPSQRDEIVIPEKQLSLRKALRNQAALAIRQTL